VSIQDSWVVGTIAPWLTGWGLNFATTRKGTPDPSTQPVSLPEQVAARANPSPGKIHRLTCFCSATGAGIRPWQRVTPGV